MRNLKILSPVAYTYETQANALSDHEILQAICETLNGKDWTPETIEFVANILITNGYHIKDVGEMQLDLHSGCCHETPCIHGSCATSEPSSC